MKIFINALLALALILASQEAFSAATCSVSTTSVNFSNYDFFAATPNDSTGTVVVLCTWPPPPPPTPPPVVTVAIGPSPTSGGFNPRQMKNPIQGDLLNYNLFTDIARTVVWGDGTQGTTTVSNKVFNNKPWTATVYGRIPAAQNVSVGLYGETLTVTITY